MNRVGAFLIALGFIMFIGVLLFVIFIPSSINGFLLGMVIPLSIASMLIGWVVQELSWNTKIINRKK